MFNTCRNKSNKISFRSAWFEAVCWTWKNTLGKNFFKFCYLLILYSYILTKTYVNIFSNLGHTTVAALIISIVSMTVLAVVKTHINERFVKKMPAPFPIELVIVVFGTVISYLCHFSTTFNVDVIGVIPAGLPGPTIPPLFIIKDMITQTILTAIVAFAINFSLADNFARLHRYKINITQELFAYGTTNIFSGFFPCFATGASLARSCVQNNAGGKTQV
jgi:solute carrier family 26, other